MAEMSPLMSILNSETEVKENKASPSFCGEVSGIRKGESGGDTLTPSLHPSLPHPTPDTPHSNHTIIITIIVIISSCQSD